MSKENYQYRKGFDDGYEAACHAIRYRMLNGYGARYEPALFGENNLEGCEKEISEEVTDATSSTR